VVWREWGIHKNEQENFLKEESFIFFKLCEQGGFLTVIKDSLRLLFTQRGYFVT
jgi:hypothetical protein